MIVFDEIYIQPGQRDADGTVKVVPCVIFNCVNGPKSHMRLWLDQIPPRVEWGWGVHESAVLVWSGDSTEPEQGGA